MNKHIKNYLKSFKFKKEYWYTLIVDGLFLGILAFGLYLFNELITKKAYLISDGKSVDQIKQMLLSMDPVKAQAFLDTLRSFVFTFMIGTVILVVGSLLLYSLSRKLIWNYLTKHKTRYWKWNVLNLVLIIPLLIYLIIFGLVKLILNSLIILIKNKSLISFLDSSINLFFLLTFITFGFLVYYNFSKKYEAWNSIGKSFHLIRKRWVRIWPLFLLSLMTAVVLSALLWPITKLLAAQTVGLGIFSGVVSLFYLAWLRLYLYRTIN